MVKEKNGCFFRVEGIAQYNSVLSMNGVVIDGNPLWILPNPEKYSYLYNFFLDVIQKNVIDGKFDMSSLYSKINKAMAPGDKVNLNYYLFAISMYFFIGLCAKVSRVEIKYLNLANNGINIKGLNLLKYLEVFLPQLSCINLQNNQVGQNDIETFKFRYQIIFNDDGLINRSSNALVHNINPENSVENAQKAAPPSRNTGESQYKIFVTNFPPDSEKEQIFKAISHEMFQKFGQTATFHSQTEVQTDHFLGYLFGVSGNISFYNNTIACNGMDFLNSQLWITPNPSQYFPHYDVIKRVVLSNYDGKGTVDLSSLQSRMPANEANIVSTNHFNFMKSLCLFLGQISNEMGNDFIVTSINFSRNKIKDKGVMYLDCLKVYLPQLAELNLTNNQFVTVPQFVLLKGINIIMDNTQVSIAEKVFNEIKHNGNVPSVQKQKIIQSILEHQTDLYPEAAAKYLMKNRWDLKLALDSFQADYENNYFEPSNFSTKAEIKSTYIEEIRLLKL